MSAPTPTPYTGSGSASGKAITDEKLLQILRQEETAAANWQNSELSGVRKKALDYYNRAATGDEEEGQSKLVTSEFADTVESIMPGLMRVFASGDDVVEFQPIEQGDEQWAKEANQYIPHVFMRENDGYRILYWFLKDALMNRLAAMTVDIEEVEKETTDNVTGWTAEQMALREQIETQQGASEVEWNVNPDQPAQDNADPSGGENNNVALMGGATFSGSVTIRKKRQRVVVDNIAPEDVLFTPDVRDLNAASFAGYRKKVTASYLRTLGLAQEEIDNIQADNTPSVEEDQRQDGQWPTSLRKDSERTMWLVVAYLKVDLNGDGISEMIRILYAHAGGQAGKIIEKMEWEDPEAPIVLGSPILMPNTLVGRSLYDQVSDLQDVGTVLTRGLADNLYLTNRPRPAINSRVSITDVIDWTPGRPISVQGSDNPGAAISWLQVPSIIEPALKTMEYFGSVRENRTGVTRYNQGLDADSLNKTASGINNIMSAAQQRQDLTARTFASTSIAPLMRLIYRAVKRSATGPTNFYAQNDWQSCDPTKWPDDMHLVVAVGTGTGNKQMEMQNLMLVGQGQQQLILAQGGPNPNGPLVTFEHITNTFRKLVEAAGFRASSQFVASTKDVQNAQQQAHGQGQPPSPEMMKVQAEMQAQQAKVAADAQVAQSKLHADQQLAQMRLVADIENGRQKAAADMQLQREKAALDMQIAREKAALDAQLKAQELQLEARLKKYEIDVTPQQANGAAIKEQQV